MDETQEADFAESLEQLAGLTLDDVAEVRFMPLPPMKGGFEVVEVKSVGRNTTKGPRLIIEAKLNVVEVASVADAAYDSQEARDKLVGKSHVEGFPIDPSVPETGLGRFKAFLADIGYTGSLQLADLINGGSANGIKFNGQVKHRKNPQDSDRPFVNVNPVVEKAAAKMQV